MTPHPPPDPPDTSPEPHRAGAQARVAAFVARHDLAKPPAFAALDLCSEAGEVAKAVLSATAYGRDASGEAFARGQSDLAGEIGDVLFSLLALANSLEIDAEAALDAALAKYAARLQQRGTAASR